jgi:hypothetical protein
VPLSAATWYSRQNSLNTATWDDGIAVRSESAGVVIPNARGTYPTVEGTDEHGRQVRLDAHVSTDAEVREVDSSRTATVAVSSGALIVLSIACVAGAAAAFHGL